MCEGGALFGESFWKIMASGAESQFFQWCGPRYSEWPHTHSGTADWTQWLTMKRKKMGIGSGMRESGRSWRGGVGVIKIHCTHVCNSQSK